MMQSLAKIKSNRPEILCSIIPYLKRKRIVCCLTSMVLIFVLSCFITFSTSKNQSFLPYRQNIEVISRDAGLYVAIDDRLLSGVIKAEKYQKFSTSIDGSIAVFLTDTKELYLVQGRKYIKLGSDILHFELSSDGQGVAFAQKYAKQNSLTLYSTKDDTKREITTFLSSFDFALSPDGNTLAYYKQIAGKDVLMCYYKGQEIVVCEEDADLVGLSDDGKHIYAVCPKSTGVSALYSFNRRGNAAELGLVTSISFKFNDDHRQIMFYNNGQTLISANGQPAITISSYPLYLVTAPNSRSASDGNAITLPVSTLFNHIYTCSDGEATSVWMICKDPDKNEKIDTRVSGCSLDHSGQYLYYIRDLSELRVMNISHGISTSLLLAENAETYAFTSDRSKVYYTVDTSLYCTSGKTSRNPKLIASDIKPYHLFMSSSNGAFYLSGDDAYLCRNGQKSILVAEDVQSMFSSANNAVYIINKSTVHAAYERRQPKLILETS